MDLRTPSFHFNHGGYYAPSNPRLCSNPAGICSYCQERIDEEDAAQTCPSCSAKGTYITHASQGLSTCNGCEDSFCTECFHGTRYCCAYIYGALPAPPRISRPSPPLSPPSPVVFITETSNIPLVGLARAPAGGTSLAPQ